MKKIVLWVALLPCFVSAQTAVKIDVIPAVQSSASAIKFVSNYSEINSIEEIAKAFKGRTVYVDLWATWCGPCVAEFAHKEGLNAFVKENDVDILYISMDAEKDNEKWKAFIEEKNLSGYHMRAYPALVSDIVALFSKDMNGRKSFGIPRYFIIKDGKIVNHDAPRPSSKETLYSELAKYVTKK